MHGFQQVTLLHLEIPHLLGGKLLDSGAESA